MNPIRVGVALGATALTLIATLAHAAPAAKPQVVDPAGDALAKGFDVVSAQLSTTGVHSVRKVGKRTVKTYTPKALVATVTLNEPPSTTPGSSVQLWVDSTVCGSSEFEFVYRPGALLNTALGSSGDLYVVGCGPNGEWLDVAAVVKGNTITWTVPLGQVVPELRAGVTFQNFRLYADVNEPLLGLLGGQDVGQAFGVGNIDYAESAVSWKLG